MLEWTISAKLWPLQPFSIDAIRGQEGKNMPPTLQKQLHQRLVFLPDFSYTHSVRFGLVRPRQQHS